LSIRLTPLTDPDDRPFSCRIAWLAADADGNPVGSAFLRLNSRTNQSHLAELVPDHRAHGLALWMKAEQIREARRDFPDLEGLLTDTVDGNVPMRHTNTHLGYQPTHELHRWMLEL
jgi:hypothetical protein